MTRNQKTHLFVSLSVLFWSISATAFKLALNNISLYLLLFISSATSLLIFGIYLIISKKHLTIINLTLKSILYSLSLGIFNPFAYYLVLFNAYLLLPAQIAQPLNFTWPIVLVLISIPILKNKITYHVLIALFISFIGVIIVSGQGKFLIINWTNPKGILLALSSSIFWALFWILNMKDNKDVVIKLFFNFLCSTILIAIVCGINGSFTMPNIKGILLSIYIGSFEMGFTFLFWLKALQYANSTQKVGNFIFLTPFISLIIIHFVLGEAIFFTTFIGLILIIAGIIYQQYSSKTKIG